MGDPKDEICECGCLWEAHWDSQEHTRRGCQKHDDCSSFVFVKHEGKFGTWTRDYAWWTCE